MQRVSLGLLAVLVLALFLIQLHVFPELKLTAAARELPGTPASMLSVLRSPLRADLLGPLALAVATFLALVLLEIKGHGLARLLLRFTATPRRSLWLTLALVAVLTRFYADPGLPHQFDAKLHVMQSAEAAHLLADGSVPDWSFTYYAGHPFLRFSGPLFFVLSGGASLLTGSVPVGIKLVLWLAHLAGAWAVFSLIREMGGNGRAAFLGALAASISFQHTHGVVLAGRLPVSLLYVFFPLLLRAAERLAKKPTAGRAVAMGVWAALLIHAHPGLAPYGILAAVVYLGTRSLLASPRRAPRAALHLALAGVIAAGLCAGLIVPALVEMPSAHGGEMYSTGGFDIDTTPDLGRIARILVWRNALAGGSITYVGISILAFLLLAFLRGWLPRGIRGALAATLFLLLFLTGGSYLSGRSVHFFVVAASAGAGFAACALGGRALPWLTLLLLLDLGATTVQSPFRPDLEYDRAFLARVRDHSGGQRALRVSLRDGAYAASEWAAGYDTGQPLITGPFREAAGAVYPLILDLLERLADDLNRGQGIEPPTLFALRVLGCRYLIFEDGTKPVVPTLSTPGLRTVPELPALLVEAAQPCVAILDPPEFERLATSDLSTWEKAFRACPPSLREPGRSGVRTVAFHFGRKRVRIVCHADRAGILLLSFSPLPGLTVTVDGEKASIRRRGPFGLTGIEVTAGAHEVELAFEAPGHLRYARFVSIAFGVLLALSAVFLSLRRPRRDAP